MLEWLSRKQMKLHNVAVPVLVIGVWGHAAAAASYWAFACAYKGYDWWHACASIKSAQHTHAEARLRSRMDKHAHLRKCLGKALMPKLLLLSGSWIAEHKACICTHIRASCMYV